MVEAKIKGFRHFYHKLNKYLNIYFSAIYYAISSFIIFINVLS